jgi:hypothetical protein
MLTPELFSTTAPDAYSSVDNGFLGLKFFLILPSTALTTECHFSYVLVYIWKLDVGNINE